MKSTAIVELTHEQLDTLILCLTEEFGKLGKEAIATLYEEDDERDVFDSVKRVGRTIGKLCNARRALEDSMAACRECMEL